MGERSFKEALASGELGLKVGMEFHQMLDTREKLFCSCPTELRHGSPDFTFVRRLRPTMSELGEVDPAALFEFKKGRRYVYECFSDVTCLVEMDEEPPHELNREALEVALMIALMLNSRPVDEVHVMRKIVIDGSNTTGFQRTALIALGGYVDVLSKRVPIQTICLEEDAARKVGEEGDKVIFRLDRLGIPLIEIATAPVINSPEEAELVAYRIGQLLRITGRVKRGIGTIRQDLNVSIRGGAKVEIKGVQKLELIGKIVEYEALRQYNLLRIRDELRGRGARPEEVREEFVDVTDVFRETRSRVLRRVVGRGGVVMAVRLPRFKGLLGREIQPGRRLGTELADRARFYAGVGGIFHSDELPGYGISREEVEEVAERVGAGGLDAFALVAAESREQAEEALKAVVERAREAVVGVPEETRAPNPDGTTRFSRPRPGAARMYPETDIRPIRVTRGMLERIRCQLPEMPERKLERFVKVYGLSRELAERMVMSYYLDLFERIVEELKVPATVVATTLENTFRSLRREGYPIDSIEEEKVVGVFRALAEGKISKEAIPDVLKYLSKEPEATVEDAIAELGLTRLSVNELRAIVREVIGEHRERVLSLGERAYGLLMGRVMSRVRGRIDGRVVSEVVKEELAEFLRRASGGGEASG
ncbi:MAG: Glu-tRNA(Gln) amidotransferase GatDE subunit E [Thermoprotei archaeon]|nr:MAG: Glu-tRNA(Gln) amidotransferase GatDE subunit E [Thermoprotei archaeon]